MDYAAHLAIYFAIYAIAAMGLNVVIGYCGLLTLAQAAYFAIGGYAFALVTVAWGGNFPSGLLAASAAGCLLSMASSLPALRLKGEFFVLATLAIQALVYSLSQNWAFESAPYGTLGNLTNGTLGVPGIPRPSGLVSLASDQLVYLGITLVAILLVSLVVYQLTKSPWRLVLVAIRDDELAAKNLGKHTRLAKIEAIAVGSTLAALSGALYASYVGYLDAGAASLNASILMLSMVIVGGVGNFRGPIVGAAVLVLVPEFLRFLALPDAVADNLRLCVYGMLLVAFMRFRPEGLAGGYRVA